MSVEVVAPTEFQGSSLILLLLPSTLGASDAAFVVSFSGNVVGNLNQRRGTIHDTETRDEEFTAVVDVSLNDMFGYSASLRGMTQGKGECTVYFLVSTP